MGEVVVAAPAAWAAVHGLTAPGGAGGSPRETVSSGRRRSQQPQSRGPLRVARTG